MSSKHFEIYFLSFLRYWFFFMKKGNLQQCLSKKSTRGGYRNFLKNANIQFFRSCSTGVAWKIPKLTTNIYSNDFGVSFIKRYSCLQIIEISRKKISCEMFNQFTFHHLKIYSFTNLLRFTPLRGHKKWLYAHCLSLRKLETEKPKVVDKEVLTLPLKTLVF